MPLPLHKAVLAVLFSWLLACLPLPAQTPPNRGGTEGIQVKPDTKRAKKLVELGTKEEAAGEYEEALTAYEEAAHCAPFDVTIVSKVVTLRARVVQGYVDSAERLNLEGNFEGAVQQLAAALHVDPSNAALLERLRQVEAMQDKAREILPEEPPQGLPKVVPNKVKKTFDLKGDVKSVYEQVAAAYGIKVVFDSEFSLRNVKLRLEDVDFETAMKVLALESGTFCRALDAKSILVANDTTGKRQAYEPVIEQTFVLPNSITATELGDIVKTVRELSGITKVQQSVNSHSLTVRDTVRRVKLAGAVIRDLERARGEVLLEIELLEVDRGNAAKLGITPPANLQMYTIPPNLISALRSAPSYSALLTLLTSIFGTSGSTGISSLSSSIPPLVAFGGGKTTFLLTLPSASADFSKSLSLVHNGRQVLLRAQDGKAATFFAGERYPITLSLLSGSLGAAGFTPSVGGTSTVVQNEQFPVGQGPVSMATADFRNIGEQDLAVLNQVDNSITILLNQGAGAATQFAQATGSPISLGPSSGSTSSVVSPAATLTVSSATLQSIAVTPATVSLAAGGTQQFTATGTFSDGTTQDISNDVTWATTNSVTATISPHTGLAQCQGVGTAQITATLGTVVSPAATVTGTSATLQSIAVTPATASLARNGTQQFVATGTFSDGSAENVTTSVTWSTSSGNVATIGGGSGLARGLSAGSTQIQATAGTVQSPAVTLTVTSATLKSIAVTPANATVAAGTSQRYTAIGTYSDTSTQIISSSVVWASSNTAVATIGASSGLATGVAAGTTSITATQGGAGTPVAIAAGSLNSNNNAFPDLIVASQVTDMVTVLLGNGDGTFTSPSSAVTYVVGNQPTAIALGEFNTNTNGNLGFVVTNFADNTYSVFTGNGDGTFAQVKGSPFPLASGESGPVAIAVDDFNQDGIPDLAIVNQTSNNVTVLKGNGDGTFTEFPGSPLAVGKFPVAISAGLLAGSTGPALAIANQSDNTVTVYLGNGNGTFVASSQSPLATSSAPGGVVIADVAGGGLGGIAVSNTGAGTVTIFLDLGSGLFTNALEPAAGTNPGAILAGDFTGSALPDIVVADNISGSPGDVTLLASPASLISGIGSTIGQTPYPGSEYADIGLKIKATPYLHANKEITLQLEYEIKAIAGSSNGIPIITNRAVTQTVRLKEEETSIVTGLLDQEETNSLTGIPGLAAAPGAGYLFGSRNNSFTDDELLILITPRTLRLPSFESRSIYAGRGDIGGRGSAGTAAAPTPVEPGPAGREAPRAPAPAEPGPENPPAPGTPPPGQPPPQPPPQEPPNPENPPQPGTPPPTRPES